MKKYLPSDFMEKLRWWFGESELSEVHWKILKHQLVHRWNEGYYVLVEAGNRTKYINLFYMWREASGKVGISVDAQVFHDDSPADMATNMFNGMIWRLV